MFTLTAPARDEAAPYYYNYIDQVPAGDIRELLVSQLGTAMAQLASLTEERSLHRYAADRWSIREVLNHLNDCERLFAFRAFWFARGFESSLPSFDEKIATRHSGADGVSWGAHVAEFRAVRAASVSLFQALPEVAWTRRGIASDNSFSVRALAYLAVGHVTHHLKVLQDRYR